MAWNYYRNRARSGYNRARGYARSGYGRARGYVKSGYSRGKNAVRNGVRFGDKDMNVSIRPEFGAGVLVGMTDADRAINPNWILLGANLPIGGRMLGKVKGLCQGVIIGNLIQTIRNQGAGVLAPAGLVTTANSPEKSVFMS